MAGLKESPLTGCRSASTILEPEALNPIIMQHMIFSQRQHLLSSDPLMSDLFTCVVCHFREQIGSFSSKVVKIMVMMMSLIVVCGISDFFFNFN